MSKKDLRTRINSLISSDGPNMLRVFIDGTPDLKWILTSTLTTEQINERIKTETQPPRLYKELPVRSDGLTVIVASEEAAEQIIEILSP